MYWLHYIIRTYLVNLSVETLLDETMYRCYANGVHSPPCPSFIYYKTIVGDDHNIKVNMLLCFLMLWFFVFLCYGSLCFLKSWFFVMFSYAMVLCYVSLSHGSLLCFLMSWSFVVSLSRGSLLGFPYAMVYCMGYTHHAWDLRSL